MFESNAVQRRPPSPFQRGVEKLESERFLGPWPRGRPSFRSHLRCMNGVTPGQAIELEEAKPEEEVEA